MDTKDKQYVFGRSICKNFKTGDNACETCIETSRYYGLEGVLGCYAPTKKKKRYVGPSKLKCKGFEPDDPICVDCMREEKYKTDILECFEAGKRVRENLEDLKKGLSPEKMKLADKVIAYVRKSSQQNGI